MALLNVKKHIVNSLGEEEELNIYTTISEATNNGLYKSLKIQTSDGVLTGYIGITEDLDTPKASSKKVEKDGVMYSERKYMGVKNMSNYMNTNYKDSYQTIELIPDDFPLDTSDSTNFYRLFYNCKKITEIPYLDTRNVTNFQDLYNGCASCVSFPEIKENKSTNFTWMYYGCSSCENFPDIDTSKGTNFGSMYRNCSSATEFPIIDTSKGTNFSNMFEGCTSLTSSPQIDLSNATNIEYIFKGCENLQDLDVLNTINPDKISSLAGLFQGLNNIDEFPESLISLIPRMKNVSYMFANYKGASPIPYLDLRNATNVAGMFNGFSGIIGGINTEGVTNLNGLFNGCGVLDLPEINATSATTISSIFAANTGYQKFPQLDTRNCTNFSNVYGISYRPGNTCAGAMLNTRKAKQMNGMYTHAYLKNYPELDTRNVNNFNDKWCYDYNNTVFPKINTERATNVSGIYPFGEITNVSVVDMSSLTSNKNICIWNDRTKYSKLIVDNLPYFITDEELLTQNKNMYNHIVINRGVDGKYRGSQEIELENVDTKNSINFKEMYKDCNNVTNISSIDFSRAENSELEGIYLDGMFENCNSLRSIEFTNVPFGTSENTIRSKTSLNEYCEIIIINYSPVEIYKNYEGYEIVLNEDYSSSTNFNRMFMDSSNLVTINGNIDMTNAIYVDEMFMNCNSLNEIPFELNTENAESLYGLFEDCFEVTSVPYTSLKNAKWIDSMYKNCRNVEHFPELDTRTVSLFSRMYMGCEKAKSVSTIDLTKAYDSDLSGVNMIDMFTGCSSLEKVKFINVPIGTTKERIRSKCYMSEHVQIEIVYNFMSMYSGDIETTEFNSVDTHEGTIFDSMYNGCKNGTLFPAIETSNGIYFREMYKNCLSATEFPMIDTSNGVYFNYMYQWCSKGISFPKLDCSSGTIFSYMYDGCKSATEFPEIITPNAINMSYMYNSCQNATTFPNIDTSNVIIFNSMYNGCKNATKVSDIDFSIANDSTLDNINTQYMFSGCSALRTITFNNLPIGTTESTLRTKCYIPDTVTEIIMNYRKV